MKERSLHRDPSASPLRWLRAWVGRAADPPLPRPPPPRLRPVRRVGPLALWEARSAVVGRVPLADFLRARLAHYEAGMGLPLARLPIRVELAEDEIRSTPVEAPAAPPAAPGDAGLAALAALEGPAAERRIEEAAARLAALEREEAAARARAEAIALRLAADVAGGAVAAAPDPAVSPHALGRPRVRTPAVLGALAAAAGAATLAEAWAVGVPMLRAIDGYPPRIEPGHDLAALALVGGSALGVAVGLVALSLVALATLAGPGPASSRATRRRFAGWGALACALAAGVTAVAAAAPVEGGAPSALRQALLLLALPTGAALAVRTAQQELAARARDREAALAWDRRLATALSARGRRLEELGLAEAQARVAARRSRGARQELRRLRARAAAAARLLARAERRDREARFRLALSLAGALERDRYEYLRQATARGLVELTPAARGAAPEQRPAPVEREGEGRVAV